MNETSIKKERYCKPAMKVYLLNNQPCLLVGSNGDSFPGGTPGHSI